MLSHFVTNYQIFYFSLIFLFFVLLAKWAPTYLLWGILLFVILFRNEIQHILQIGKKNKGNTEHDNKCENNKSLRAQFQCDIRMLILAVKALKTCRKPSSSSSSSSFKKISSVAFARSFDQNIDQVINELESVFSNFLYVYDRSSFAAKKYHRQIRNDSSLDVAKQDVISSLHSLEVMFRNDGSTAEATQWSNLDLQRQKLYKKLSKMTAELRDIF